MLDKKSMLLLKTLSKLTEGNAYKVVTSDEILLSISNRSQFDHDSVRQIIDFLEKQEYINIKFCEENTYCYSLLPKGRILLEQENNKTKPKKNNITFANYLFITIASFLGSMLAIMIFFYLNF